MIEFDIIPDINKMKYQFMFGEKEAGTSRWVAYKHRDWKPTRCGCHGSARKKNKILFDNTKGC